MSIKLLKLNRSVFLVDFKSKYLHYFNIPKSLFTCILMCIPDIIEAGTSTEPHGIIYSIRKIVSNDKILKYVSASTTARSIEGSIETLVKWDNESRSSDDDDNNNNVYVQIEFKNRFVHPTNYSFKGISTNYYSKEWKLYGLNSPNEEPTLLSTASSAGSSYCGDGTNCNSDSWGTFATNPTDKSFRFFRINCTKSSITTVKWRITLAGFEIFGTLSRFSNPNIMICYKSCRINNHIPAFVFLRMFSIYLS